MILNEFFNLPQVFEKDMTEGVMSEIDAELRNIVAREDFDALYELFSANTPAGRYVQDMYDDVVIDAGLHPDDDFERIEQIVFDRLADDFGEQDMTEKRGDLRPKLGSARDRGKSVRKWRHNRGLDEQGVEEGPTDDPRFQKMMGNIQKSTPKYVPVTGYVAVSFASEQGSKKIKGVSRNGKPIPTNIDDPDQFLSGKIEFTPDQVEQQLMSIGKKYGWDSIDSGQSQGFTEMFFDTAKEYTSNNYPYLATNIVKTVKEINKFFADINKSLQTTGLPGYVSDVWQGIGPPENTNQIEDLDQIIRIAKKTAPKADPGPEIGKVILANYERFGGEDGYSRSELDQAAKIAKIYITQGERAGFQAQHNSDVSDMIDELLSDAGSDIRTIYTDDPLNPMQIEDQGVAEGIFGSRPSPVLPIVDKIAKVARGLTPQNVEVGKQIIQANARDITRMLSPQDKAGVDVIEQGVAEATGDEKFDTMMGQIQREPKYPDSQMPPTDVKDLYQWAVKNNKPYHKIFAEWANREGYKSVAPALQRAGNLDTEALDYWTPRVWKIYWGEVRGIDSEMPPEWSKKRVPDELRDYLETVFDAYDRIVFDWPTEYRQIGGQDNYVEAKGDYVPPKEANYDDKYQAMVRRVGQKAKQQEKAKQQPKAPVRESRLALLKQIIQS